VKEEIFRCRACDVRYGDILDTAIYINGVLIYDVGTVIGKSEMTQLDKCTTTVSVRRKIGVVTVPYSGIMVGDVIVGDVSKAVKHIPRGTLVTSSLYKKLTHRPNGVIYVDRSRQSEKDTRDITVTLSKAVKGRVLSGVKYIFSNNRPSETFRVAREVTDLLCDTIINSDATLIALNELKISDDYTFKHSVDVATMAAFLGRVVGLNPIDVRELGLSGLLHDIGKTKIDPAIINSPNKLTDAEFKEIQKHPTYGKEMCEKMANISPEVIAGVYEHQEKYNGKGYPRKLIGCDISLFGRILAVCDVYDALVTPRSYKPGMSSLKAMSIMMSDKGHFDDYYLAALRTSIQFFVPGDKVRLTDGREAIVIHNTPSMPFSPVVKIKGKIYDMAHNPEFSNIHIVGVPNSTGGCYGD